MTSSVTEYTLGCGHGVTLKTPATIGEMLWCQPCGTFRRYDAGTRKAALDTDNSKIVKSAIVFGAFATVLFYALMCVLMVAGVVWLIVNAF